LRGVPGYGCTPPRSRSGASMPPPSKSISRI